jgi:hypothetical protein
MQLRDLPPYTDPKCPKCNQVCPCSTTTEPPKEEEKLSTKAVFQREEEKIKPSFKSYERQWLHQGERSKTEHMNEPWYTEWLEWLELWHQVDITTRVGQDLFRMQQMSLSFRTYLLPFLQNRIYPSASPIWSWTQKSPVTRITRQLACRPIRGFTVHLTRVSH